MKTAIYIRVSTEEQAKEGYSIDAQRNKLKAYCISQGWDIVDFYVDEGQSAKDVNRTNLQRMIKHIKEGLIECVLVYRLDRLTRSVLDLYKLLELFDAHNCKFKSATEVYDTTTAMGRMFITIVAALAQWERENLGERIRMGMQEKARQGKWTINLPPYGFEIKDDLLEVVEDEAKLVRKIYSLYLGGLSCRKIAVQFNQEGIPNNRGNTWNDNKIKYILKNPIYMGTMRYNYRVNKENYFEVENVTDAIIDEATFNETQSLLKRRSVNHPRAATSEFYFSGVAKCGKCGAPLYGKRSTSKRGDKSYTVKSYACSRKRNGLCNQPAIAENFIENRFLYQLDKIVVSDDAFPEFKKDTKVDEKIKELHKELEDIEKRRKKWQYAWVNEMLTDAAFTDRMKEEELKEQRFLKELSSLNPNDETVTPDELKGMLRNIRENWIELEPLEKKSLLQIAVKKITVSKISPRLKPESVHVDIEFN